MNQKKAINILMERSIARHKALNNFNALHQEDKIHLRHEYDSMKEDQKIVLRGRKFEDFLIYKFNLNITTFDEIKKFLNRIQIELKEITNNLNEIIHKQSKNEIEPTEFVRIYKSSEKGLYDLEYELKIIERFLKN